jgi:integrase
MPVHYEGNITPEDKALLQSYRQDPYYSDWVKILHPRTRVNYESCLFRVLKGLGLNPTQVIDLAKTDNDALSKRFKVFLLSANNGISPSYKIQMRAAFKSFLNLHELDVKLLGLKIKTTKTSKPYLSWEDAERIISLASPEYAPIYTFMLYSGLDTERFRQLNTDTKRLADIRKQLEDVTKLWIKVDIPEGRKQSSPYYVLVPPSIAKLLPVLDQSGRPIHIRQNIHYAWAVARVRAGFNYARFGQHNLRSVWDTEATKRGLPKELREFQLGHEVDSYHYQRINQDLPWVIQQFNKAFEAKPLATMQQLEALQQENQSVKEITIDLLRGEIAELEESLSASEDLIGEPPKFRDASVSVDDDPTPTKPEYIALKTKLQTRKRQLAQLTGQVEDKPPPTPVQAK